MINLDKGPTLSPTRYPVLPRAQFQNGGIIGDSSGGSHTAGAGSCVLDRSRSPKDKDKDKDLKAGDAAQRKTRRKPNVVSAVSKLDFEGAGVAAPQQSPTLEVASSVPVASDYDEEET